VDPGEDSILTAGSGCTAGRPEEEIGTLAAAESQRIVAAAGVATANVDMMALSGAGWTSGMVLLPAPGLELELVDDETTIGGLLFQEFRDDAGLDIYTRPSRSCCTAQRATECESEPNLSSIAAQRTNNTRPLISLSPPPQHNVGRARQPVLLFLGGGDIYVYYSPSIIGCVV
jgi:hypothetical protein